MPMQTANLPVQKILKFEDSEKPHFVIKRKSLVDSDKLDAIMAKC